MAEKYKAKLEEYEAGEKAKGKLFDPKALVESTKTLQTVEDPELGIVKFGVLTHKDLLQLRKIEDEGDRTTIMLHRMLVKAYPDLTLEDVENFPMEKSSKLLTLLTGGADFLKRIK